MHKTILNKYLGEDTVLASQVLNFTDNDKINLKNSVIIFLAIICIMKNMPNFLEACDPEIILYISSLDMLMGNVISELR